MAATRWAQLKLISREKETVWLTRYAQRVLPSKNKHLAVLSDGEGPPCSDEF